MNPAATIVWGKKIEAGFILPEKICKKFVAEGFIPSRKKM
jgi:hypothetical protein